ncbi:hypothetical protein B0J13DRAFT_556650 [Dactylonectria estremocensis]|uniref:4-coumarate-CoA ligase n=1 Tax=Dactylonectria estremocensis TaxID=1079267 RepID=A0A9P9EPC3_9HYPO|nr:hypothetical protein B0J13DRAFT_556650 [Dactylonectria estremocensis]
MIYNKDNVVPIPSVDVLTFLFDSEHCRAKEDTPIHAEARDPARYITKSQARDLTKNFAHFLRHSFGIGATGPGKDVVVTVSTGQSALACLFFGVVAAEGIYSAASPASTVKDLARQIKDGPGNLVVCSQDLKQLAVAAAKSAGLSERNVLVLESHPDIKLESADGSLACDFKASLDWRRITDSQELETSKICILYSSGTTGLPKGMLISHTNIVAEATLPAAVSRPVFDEEARNGNPFHHRTLGHLPTAHIAGVQGYFINPFYEGGIVYWMPTFKFDDFLRYCEELRITGFFTVPPIYMAIAKHPAVKDQFRHMRSAICGAAPLTGELQQAATRKMKMAASVRQTWGLSETTGSATFVTPGTPVTMGSLGSPLPNVLLRLVNDDENDVKPGEPGEALIKGPIVTQGYHNNPDANQKAFTLDGWLRTGDILEIKGTDLFIVDRKKELIKYKGLQVAPAELEGLLASHTAVVDAAVIGIAQDGTEVPRAYVVLAPLAKGKVSETDLMEYVQSRVSDHKRLRGGVRFIDAVPRSPSGKILRKDVREMRKLEERDSKL